MSRRNDLLTSAIKVIDDLPNATKAAKDKLKKDAAELDDTKLEEFIKQHREPQEKAPEPPKPEPPFTVPLKELMIGKAGVSDLFKKQNEVIKYLNALTSKPKAP